MERRQTAAFLDLPLLEEDIEQGHEMPALQRLVYKIRQREREHANLPRGALYGMFGLLCGMF